jgi:hypothetical protein
MKGGQSGPTQVLAESLCDGGSGGAPHCYLPIQL